MRGARYDPDSVALQIGDTELVQRDVTYQPDMIIIDEVHRMPRARIERLTLRASYKLHQLPPGYGQGRVLLSSVNKNYDLKQNYTYDCKLCGKDEKCKCVMVEGHGGCESARQGRMG